MITVRLDETYASPENVERVKTTLSEYDIFISDNNYDASIPTVCPVEAEIVHRNNYGFDILANPHHLYIVLLDPEDAYIATMLVAFEYSHTVGSIAKIIKCLKLSEKFLKHI